jgi:DNA-binding MarR family transcriptional regulator
MRRDTVDEMTLLGWLHNLGALDESRALSVPEIAHRIGLEQDQVRGHMEKLLSLNYVSRKVGYEDSYYLNSIGILRIVKTYT